MKFKILVISWLYMSLLISGTQNVRKRKAITSFIIKIFLLRSYIRVFKRKFSNKIRHANIQTLILKPTRKRILRESNY